MPNQRDKVSAAAEESENFDGDPILYSYSFFLLLPQFVINKETAKILFIASEEIRIIRSYF